MKKKNLTERKDLDIAFRPSDDEWVMKHAKELREKNRLTEEDYFREFTV